MKFWPKETLADLLAPSGVQVTVRESDEYPNAGIYSYARGLFHKPPISGLKTSAMSLTRASKGDFIYSRLFAFEGAYGLVADEFDGCYFSNEYPTFRIDTKRLHPGFLGLYFKQPRVWADIAQGSIGVGFRRQRVQPTQLLKHSIPLPPLAEQQAIFARLEALTEKARQVAENLDAIEADAERLLAVRFREVITSTTNRRMAEVAPLVRREEDVVLDGSYPELGIRSFGKGTFHKPPLSGAEAGSKRLFRIEPGDLLFSNVFAWEGAIAIAKPEDAARFGSHRFITCVANRQLASAEFLRYYFLSEVGLEKIREASPGGAGRNRTLGVEKLAAIEVPVPSLTRRRAFDALQFKVSELKAQHAAIREANRALIPASLERIFSISEGQGATA